MWIKICGNTRLEDCLLSCELGADAVGFVFAPGKRTVAAALVSEITAKLPEGVEKIGVFTSLDPDEIAQTVVASGLTGVQLHGAYDPLLAGAVKQRCRARGGSLRVLQVLPWDLDARPATEVERLAASAKAATEDGLVDVLLIDSRTRGASGGTGQTFDWAAAKPALEGLRLPVIVAGGLRAENVAGAIGRLQPWGVDVSSGVERAPGVKDAVKLRQFFENARIPA